MLLSDASEYNKDHCDLNVVHTSFGTNKTSGLQTVHSHGGVIGQEGPLVGVGDGDGDGSTRGTIWHELSFTEMSLFNHGIVSAVPYQLTSRVWQ